MIEQTLVVFQFHRGNVCTQKFTITVPGVQFSEIALAIGKEMARIGKATIAESVGGPVERMTIELSEDKPDERDRASQIQNGDPCNGNVPVEG